MADKRYRKDIYCDKCGKRTTTWHDHTGPFLCKTCKGITREKIDAEFIPSGGTCYVNIRGNKYTWKLLFWWDHTLPSYMMTHHWKIYYFFKFTLRSIRYKTVFDTKTHEIYQVDRFKPWKRKKKLGVFI